MENGKGKRAVYDGQAETLSELEDDGSLFGECSKKATAECDVVVTNPPFKKYSAMLKDVIGKKDFVLMAPHILPYRINDVENQIIYRIAKGEVFIEPKEIAIWNEDRTRAAACVVISTIKPEGVEKVDIDLSAKYDPARHKMFINVETGKPTGVVNCDRFKDFPVDWPGLVAVPVTTLMKIANQKVHVIDVHGMDGYSKYANNVSAIELVDSVTIHGYHGRAGYRHDGVVDTNTIELVDSQAVHGCFNAGNQHSGKDLELVDVNDVYGQLTHDKDGRFNNGIQTMETVDVIDIHGFFGKGDADNPYMQFEKH